MKVKKAACFVLSVAANSIAAQDGVLALKELFMTMQHVLFLSAARALESL
ncbi:MAG: hypothetical protein LBU77_05555 [Clostridiales bacterium]|nr:hypothetical protein [Clostridiales bacterium]